MKLSLDEILTLIGKAGEAGLDSFSYRDGDIRIKIRKDRSGNRRKDREVPENIRAGQAGEPAEQIWAGEPETGVQAGHPGQALPAADPAEHIQPEEMVQNCPMVGIFYASDTEGGEPLVRAGDTVKKGQVIGIIEAMKLMNEVRSEYDGTVAEVLAQNGQIVEYGQPLFRIVKG